MLLLESGHFFSCFLSFFIHFQYYTIACVYQRPAFVFCRVFFSIRTMSCILCLDIQRDHESILFSFALISAACLIVAGVALT